MAALRARQESEARANESLAQQRQMNHQMWIQNQLLSGRSMQDIEAQIDANDAAASRQRRANDEANEAKSARMGAFLICALLAIFLSTRVVGMSVWPSTLIWVGIPVVLLIGWLALLHVTTPPARHAAGPQAQQKPAVPQVQQEPTHWWEVLGGLLALVYFASIIIHVLWSHL